jgi:hypothetical protein
MRNPYVNAGWAAIFFLFLSLRPLLAECVSAFADLQARMRLSAACGAFLLPALASRLLDLWFGRSRGSEANEPRLIGLLNGALGMNAAQ